MSSSNQTVRDSTRWWEFYAVRYAMGTVVGGVIFFFLCNTNPVLKHLLFGAEAGQIDGPLLVLLAGYGLAYCYIASAPILVFHAGRFLFSFHSGGWKSMLYAAACIVPPLIAAILFYFLFSEAHGTTLVFYSFVFALAALVIWPQYLTAVVTLFRTKDLFCFYNQLASKRGAQTAELVTSYRHLREHGNSFAIVVLEIILAIIFYTAGNMGASMRGAVGATGDVYVLPYVEIVLVWIVPAALIWLVGALLERQFIETWP